MHGTSPEIGRCFNTCQFQCCVGIRSCFVLKDGLDSSHGSFISSFPQPVGVGALRAGGLFAAKLFAPGHRHRP